MAKIEFHVCWIAIQQKPRKELRHGKQHLQYNLVWKSMWVVRRAAAPEHVEQCAKLFILLKPMGVKSTNSRRIAVLTAICLSRIPERVGLPRGQFHPSN
ncbi:hypothetical protein OH492_17425 [Vibrio chagasii]|nr:hypothetical protein [Vibrio chagasii]